MTFLFCPRSWSEPSAYGTVPCIVSAGAVACGREHGQKKEQKETKRGEGTGIPACSVSLFARHGRALTGVSPEHAQIVGSV